MYSSDTSCKTGAWNTRAREGSLLVRGSGVAGQAQACRLGEVQHALERLDRTRDQRGIDLDLAGAVAQRVQGAFQRVHGRPGAVGATAAGGTAACCRRLDELLCWAPLRDPSVDAHVGG